MSVLVVESFIVEKLGITYEEIKELVISQYDIEKNNRTNENTENQNDKLFKDDRLTESSKIEYLYKYLLVKTNLDDSDDFTYVDRRFQLYKLKNTFKMQRTEKYSMDGESLCESEFFTDGLSNYYDLLIFIACILDMYKYKSKWENYFSKTVHCRTIKLESLLLSYYRALYQNEYDNMLLYKEPSKYYIRNEVHDLSIGLLKHEEKKRLYSYDCYIYLYDKIMTIDYYLNDSNHGWKVAHQHSLCHLSYYCSQELLERYDYKNSLLYVGLAIKSDEYNLLKNAYNLLGYCAASSNNFKLAYDTLFSWFHSKLLSSLKKPCGLDNASFQKVNSILRKDSIKALKEQDVEWLGYMYVNFAYVCGELMDLVESEKNRYKLFLLAEFYIDQAIKCDRSEKERYFYKGQLYAKIKDYKTAIECFSKSIEPNNDIRERVDILRCMIQAYQHMLVRRKKTFDEVTKKYVSSYQDLLDDSAINYSVLYGRDLYVLLSKCDCLSEKNKELKYELFEIDNEVNEILGILRRTPKPYSDFDIHNNLLNQEAKNAISKKRLKSYTYKYVKKEDENEIVYYTTLGNLNHLFSDVTLGVDTCKEAEKENKQNNSTKQKNESNGKKSIEINCLSIMHARYMNDPEEGLVLFKHFSKCFINEPEELREMLYDQKYVFLKSFTGLVDKLNMWTMYGTDHSTNSDCNGCCVCLAPETFSPRSVYKDRMDSKKWKHFDDDYGLYFVAYFDGDKILVNGQESKELEYKFELLKSKLKKVHEAIKSASEEDQTIITDCLVRMLEKLVFLVKDASYSQEVESRIILSRDINDRFDINETEQKPDEPLNPSKLFINPPFQVYVKKLILGPKLENPDYWIPHLQYELSKMHDKWVYGEERDYIPKVRLSDINIR